MATLHFSHRQEKTDNPTNKIIKKVLFGIALFSLLSTSATAHDFDISNPELLQIELNDTILVRPPPMVNPPTKQYSDIKVFGLSLNIYKNLFFVFIKI